MIHAHERQLASGYNISSLILIPHFMHCVKSVVCYYGIAGLPLEACDPILDLPLRNAVFLAASKSPNSLRRAIASLTFSSPGAFGNDGSFADTE